MCNHPELFERNEGSSYFYFAEIPNSLLPSPLEGVDVNYAGNRNPITYKVLFPYSLFIYQLIMRFHGIGLSVYYVHEFLLFLYCSIFFKFQVPKLIHQEIIRSTEVPFSVPRRGVHCEYFERLFDIFSPGNIYESELPKYKCLVNSSEVSGTFGFTRLMDLSPIEVSFLAKCVLLERLFFSVLRWNRQLIDETLDLFMETEGDDLENSHLDRQTTRTIARMLLLPTRSEASLLRRRLATGLGDAPYEALVTSHNDRYTSNIRLLRAMYAFIPRARAPPVSSIVYLSFTIADIRFSLAIYREDSLFKNVA